ncbi:flagellar basal body-associated FliL family protein [Candidatus Sumerlaeota bacterium]|nr:flagellar basal body-associated FliL family protein [Candidatus Sumerlaeota bacterium]
MRSIIALSALLLMCGPLGAAPSQVRSHERINTPPSLGEFRGLDAQSFIHLANPAREMVDGDAQSAVERVPMASRPNRPPAEVRLPQEFSSGDVLYRYLNNRVNLRGGHIPRFLKLDIYINFGTNTGMPEALSDVDNAPLNDVVDHIFGPLSFNDVRHPSQKRDLREEMIMGFNEVLGTDAVLDIYYIQFLVF